MLAFPDRCRSFRTTMATIRVAFPDRCMSFRNVTTIRTFWVLAFPPLCLSGPERQLALFGCGPEPLQAPKTLEYVLGACCPDRCRSFRTTMATIRIRFGCLLFRTAGPRNLQLEYVLNACFSGPLHVFPDHNGYN